nr:host cell division inhibitor Icd-like protein [Serratia sp. PAMC26656]
MNHKKHLTCDSVKFNLNHTMNIQMAKNGEARQCANTNRASNHNDRTSIEVAMSNITTAPKRFAFLFLAVVRANPQAHPHREEITAISERKARSLLAGRFVLVFAGRLPVLGGIHA